MPRGKKKRRDKQIIEKGLELYKTEKEILKSERKKRVSFEMR